MIKFIFKCYLSNAIGYFSCTYRGFLIYHLKKSEISDEDMVEIDVGGFPGVVEVFQVDTFRFIRYDGCVDDQTTPIHAASESAAEQVHPHDAEDEPEDEADQEDIADSWNGLDQRVHHHLQHPT